LTLKILADENIPGLECDPGHAELRRVAGRDIQPGLLHDVDILLVRSVTPVDEALLSGSPVRFVGSATSGIDHVDRGYLRQRGIGFAYAPGSNANSVVEYVLSAIAATGNTLEVLLDGGTVGIVGFGHVGSALAARLDGLGIVYQVYDPWLDQQSIPLAAGLEEVLGCDVISLHPELTRASPWPSYHLLGQCELSQLGQQRLLINASRGAVVDNAALVAQLELGVGPMTVLDVWEGEPVLDARLLERVVLGTPHIAGYSLDAKLRATQMLGTALAEFLDQPPVFTGNPPGRPAPVHVPGPSSNADLLRALLGSRYAIRHDDARLRQVVLEQGSDDGAGFDALRRSYGDRRELAGSTVSCDNPLTEFSALVAALGCDLDPGAGQR
jgi:erythronate-4-phosphate dehydrogenase